MTDLTTPPPPSHRAVRNALDGLLSGSGPTFMACYTLGPCHDASELRDAARRAEMFLTDVAVHGAAMRAAAEVLADDEVGRLVMVFVSAWPNASNGDLAGYGAQLLDDLLSEAPCRHALAETFRVLRRTLRFLPSIAEVLTELEVHQARVRNTLAHIQRLPALVESLKAMAGRREQAEAELQARRERASA